MSTYISVDGGTTNTRVRLVKDNKIISSVKYGEGASKGEKGKEAFEKNVKKGIETVLKNSGADKSEIKRILASGMITSDGGMVNLEHIKAPAGIKELADSSKEVIIDSVSDIPFVFIRGVKTDCQSIENADMMRGEETEVMGLCNKYGNGVYMLMGSHTKMVKISEGKIIDLKTFLTGEMIFAISTDTILKNSFSFESSLINKEYLVKGYDYCEKNGLNDSLFKVRILKNIFNKSSDEVYSFFIGACLYGDADYLKNEKENKIIVSGNKKLRDALFIILKEKGFEKAEIVSDEISDMSVAKGQIKIYESIGE